MDKIRAAFNLLSVYGHGSRTGLRRKGGRNVGQRAMTWRSFGIMSARMGLTDLDSHAVCWGDLKPDRIRAGGMDYIGDALYRDWYTKFKPLQGPEPDTQLILSHTSGTRITLSSDDHIWFWILDRVGMSHSTRSAFALGCRLHLVPIRKEAVIDFGKTGSPLPRL